VWRLRGSCPAKMRARLGQPRPRSLRDPVLTGARNSAGTARRCHQPDGSAGRVPLHKVTERHSSPSTGTSDSSHDAVGRVTGGAGSRRVNTHHPIENIDDEKCFHDSVYSCHGSKGNDSNSNRKSNGRGV
jgi:hypothetical protein